MFITFVFLSQPKTALIGLQTKPAKWVKVKHLTDAFWFFFVYSYIWVIIIIIIIICLFFLLLPQLFSILSVFLLNPTQLYQLEGRGMFNSLRLNSS